MASIRIDTYIHQLQFPIGALIISKGVDRLIRAGTEEPFQFLRRHARGDWGDGPADQWEANIAGIQSEAKLESFYVATNGQRIRIFTEADRSATHIVLASEN